MNKEQIIALVHSGEFKLAKTNCLKLLKKQPGNAELVFLLGNISNRTGDYTEAIECYSKVIEIRPDLPSAHYNLGCAFRNMGKFEVAVNSIKKAVELQPDLFEAWDTLGLVYNQLNMSLEAVRCHKNALRINPNYALADENLAKAYTVLVPQWHFPMMNDLIRNEAYNKALARVVNNGSTILDIGTGSGLLSMMAAKEGAKHVYACEMNSLVANKAVSIIKANNYDEKITVLNKKSTDIKVGVDLAEKADILVSEILDVGLLAEGVLTTVQHAKNNLLKEGAVVIPEEAEVYGVIIESQDIYNEYHVGHVSGFDLSLFNEFSVKEYMQKKINDFNHNELTDIFKLFTIKLDGSEVKPEKITLNVPVLVGGAAHALAFWFKVKLCDDIYLDTGPHENSCWMQAVTLQENPINFKKGEQVTIDASHDCNRILIEAVTT